jgi:RNA polymerase nonessential primary-like sigma factor
VIEERFGLSGDDGKTLMALGNQMGLMRERVRQLQEQALAKLRKMFARRDACQLVA